MLDYSVTVRPYEGSDSLLAFVDIVIAGQIVLQEFKIQKSKNGAVYVAGPQRKTNLVDANGKAKYLDIIRFIDESDERDPDDKFYKTPLQKEIYAVILDEYNRLTNGRSGGATSKASTTPTATSTSKKATKNPLWPS